MPGGPRGDRRGVQLIESPPFSVSSLLGGTRRDDSRDANNCPATDELRFFLSQFLRPGAVKPDRYSGSLPIAAGGPVRIAPRLGAGRPEGPSKTERAHGRQVKTACRLSSDNCPPTLRTAAILGTDRGTLVPCPPGPRAAGPGGRREAKRKVVGGWLLRSFLTTLERPRPDSGVFRSMRRRSPRVLCNQVILTDKNVLSYSSTDYSLNGD